MKEDDFWRGEMMRMVRMQGVRIAPVGVTCTLKCSLFLSFLLWVSSFWFFVLADAREGEKDRGYGQSNLNGSQLRGITESAGDPLGLGHRRPDWVLTSPGSRSSRRHLQLRTRTREDGSPDW